MVLDFFRLLQEENRDCAVLIGWCIEFPPLHMPDSIVARAQLSVMVFHPLLIKAKLIREMNT